MKMPKMHCCDDPAKEVTEAVEELIDTAPEKTGNQACRDRCRQLEELTSTAAGLFATVYWGEERHCTGEWRASIRKWRDAYRKTLLTMLKPDTEEASAPAMTPQEFAEKMKALSKDSDDLAIHHGNLDHNHRKADDILCDILETVGYREGAAIFRDLVKWYA